MTEYYVKGLFLVLVPILLAYDWVQNRNPHVITPKEAITQSLFWITISIVFGGIVWWGLGAEKGAEFFTAYGIEKMLSVDNLFVFALIFGAFRVDESVRHKVLFYGIIGAIVLRAIFIFLGSGLISLTYLPDFELAGLRFESPNLILILFGFFLIYAGFKSFGAEDGDEDIEENKAVQFSRWLFSKVKYTGTYEGSNFVVFKNGVRYFTLLSFVVLVVELTDLLFAVDSIPAIFTVSKDPFILYSSNIFAILGLRALYFLLDVAKRWFRYLPYGVAGILVFIGLKMVAAPIYHISSLISLFVVTGLLVASILFSVIAKPATEQ
jgi:tellurite resistance protein TerC